MNSSSPEALGLNGVQDNARTAYLSLKKRKEKSGVKQPHHFHYQLLHIF